ncbi:hypothetical protein TIFTF001_017298 [Ficus carica]|uniref:Uncharacterized protein n=1 Tax=Ficus carica TaxID=3494 RepID=A0AA88A7T5_FICCA|nr:hypothetical protein TIFTF001_017298 [Ficus carica]
MSDVSDSENAQMSGDVDATGSSSSILSSSSDTTGTTGGAAVPRDKTPDHLSGISDIPSPNQGFIEELNGAAQVQSAPVVDFTAGGDEASERTASQASTSGQEGSDSSWSTPPAGEPVQARDCSVFLMDYFTLAVTLSYLTALRE